MKAIEELVADRSVPADVTRDRLKEARDEIDLRIDAIEQDLVDQKFSSQG